MRCFLLSVLVACAHAPQTRIAVRVPEVVHHLDDLGNGMASLETVVITKSGRVLPGERESVFADQTVVFDDTTTSLLALMAGCGPFAARTPCRLSERDDRLIVLRTVETRKPMEDQAEEAQPIKTNGENAEVRVVAGTLTLAGLAGAGLCVAICDEHKAEISIALGAGALIAAVVWAVASGAHD